MEKLIEYLNGHMKCYWELYDNTLIVYNEILSFSFIEKVNELNPIYAFRNYAEGSFLIAFNTEGIGTKQAKVIAKGEKPEEEVHYVGGSVTV